MRLSTWLIVMTSSAYAIDVFVLNGKYSGAVITLFRHVGLGVLAGFGYYG